MRAATASAREPRGERTLMGIGPEFIRREVVSDGISGTLDGVPNERMDRTPSSPIVVEPQAVAAAPTVRIPLPAPDRTVQLSMAPAATVVLPVDQPANGNGPSLRLNSLISGRFFQEGEQQEAKNWEDSPLVNEPFPDELPPKISSFDHVPRHRGPLLVTTFLLGTALVIGLAVEGAGTRAARTWLANEAGPKAVEVWNRAKTGLAIRLTPEDTAASARAMAAPAATEQPAAPAPEVKPAVAVAPAAATVPAAPAAATVPAAAPQPADNGSTEDLWAPLVAAGPRPPITPHVRRVTAPEEHSRAAARAESRALDEDASRPSAREDETKPRRGLVWSPSEERLVPVQQASAPAPAADTDSRAGTTGDKDVLPLDDEAHTTY